MKKRNKEIAVASSKLSQLAADKEEIMPIIVASSSYPTRRNAAAIVERTDRYTNIENGIVPFKTSVGGITTASTIDVRDTVLLCQKAYYNFSIFRNTIDLMTEFSASSIHLRGGSKKSRDFFNSYFAKINLSSFQDKFFREYYRSGNVFIYKMNGDIQEEDIKKLNQVYGSSSKAAKVTIPVRYIILNPADIQVGGNLSFSSPQYYKLLTDYELERLKNPRTDEDREVLANLPPEVIQAIKTKRQTNVLLPLNLSEVVSVFYKKQDYEPFAVPMGFPVLEDINWKAEMKKMDMAATRTMQQIILLVTMGAEPDKGGVNQKALEAVSNFFKNESVARVLVADYTTDAKFIIPDIASFLDPKKYDMVDRDIKEGLNYIIAGQNDKYANASSKIDVFIQRLTQARESFLSEFLIPEIKKISQELGLKNYPLPYFEDIDMKDGLEYNKVYTRLIELGVLTPEEGIEAMQSGKLPNKEESIVNQEEFRKLKDKGYYEPLTGGPNTQMQMQDGQFKNQQKVTDKQQEHDSKMKTKELKHKAENPEQVAPQIVISGKPGSPAGRPTGTKSKQTTKKPTRIGGSEEGLFSVSRLKNNLIAFSNLNQKVTSEIVKKYNAEKLTEEQQELAEQISEIIIANELPENWSQSINKYIEEPIDTNPEAVKEIQSIAAEHQVNEFMASLLYHSKCQETE